MKIKSLLLLGCALPLYAAGQIQAPAAGPADLAAAVPAPVFRSAFPQAQGGMPAAPGDWRGLNAEVGQFHNGHIDTSKWEARNAAASSGPAAPTAPAAAAPGHKHGHGMHHGHGNHDGQKPGSKP